MTIVDAERIWQSIDGKKRRIADAEIEEVMESKHCGEVANLVCLLKDPRFKISILPETKVNEKKVSCVRVSAKGHKDVKLFFDMSDGLLLKCERTASLDGKSLFVKASIYSDYRDMDGLMYSMKTKTLHDCKPILEAEIIEIKFPTKVDAAVFKVPKSDQD